MKLKLENAIRLQSILDKAGYKTLAAGGYVRSYLLGEPAADIDLATTALPAQVITTLSKYKDIKIIETGIQHGTVTAIMDNIGYEITTLRVDKVCKGREADVEFVKDFEEDAKRRDFTVNAIYMNLETGEIVDFVGGIGDLRKKVLKFVGDPEKRIREDFLRILRLYRFASTLAFKIDFDSDYSARKFLPYLVYITPERTREELLKMLVGRNIEYILVDKTDVLFQVLPELQLIHGFKQNCEYHCYDVYEHTIKGVVFLAKTPDKKPYLSFAHLFHDIAKPFCHSTIDGVDHFYGHQEESARVAVRVCERLKFSANQTKYVRELITNHMRFSSLAMSNKAYRRFMYECIELKAYGGEFSDFLEDLMLLVKADYTGMKTDKMEYCDEIIKKVRANAASLYAIGAKNNKIESPLDGMEIMELFNLSTGRMVGDIKNYLKDLTVQGEISTKEDAIERAKLYIINKE